MSTPDCIDEAARYLATEPAAVERALRTHVQRPDGRCAVCGDRGGLWPCAVSASAHRAQQMIDVVGRG